MFESNRHLPIVVSCLIIAFTCSMAGCLAEKQCYDAWHKAVCDCKTAQDDCRQNPPQGNTIVCGPQFDDCLDDAWNQMSECAEGCLDDYRACSEGQDDVDEIRDCVDAFQDCASWYYKDPCW